MGGNIFLYKWWNEKDMKKDKISFEFIFTYKKIILKFISGYILNINIVIFLLMIFYSFMW